MPYTIHNNLPVQFNAIPTVKNIIILGIVCVYIYILYRYT